MNNKEDRRRQISGSQSMPVSGSGLGYLAQESDVPAPLSIVPRGRKNAPPLGVPRLEGQIQGDISGLLRGAPRSLEKLSPNDDPSSSLVPNTQDQVSGLLPGLPRLVDNIEEDINALPPGLPRFPSKLVKDKGSLPPGLPRLVSRTGEDTDGLPFGLPRLVEKDTPGESTKPGVERNNSNPFRKGRSDTFKTESNSQERLIRQRGAEAFSELNTPHESATARAVKNHRARYQGLSKQPDGDFEDIVLDDYREFSSRKKNEGRNVSNSFRPSGPPPTGALPDLPRSSSPFTAQYVSGTSNTKVSTRNRTRILETNSLRTEIKLGVASDSSPYTQQQSQPTRSFTPSGSFNQPRDMVKPWSSSSRSATVSGVGSARDGSTVDNIYNAYVGDDDAKQDARAQKRGDGFAVEGQGYSGDGRGLAENRSRTRDEAPGGYIPHGRKPPHLGIGPSFKKSSSQSDTDNQLRQKSSPAFTSAFPQRPTSRDSSATPEPFKNPKLTRSEWLGDLSKAAGSDTSSTSTLTTYPQDTQTSSRHHKGTNMDMYRVDIGAPPEYPAADPLPIARKPLERAVLDALRRSSALDSEYGFPTSDSNVDIVPCGSLRTQSPDLPPLRREYLEAVARASELPPPRPAELPMPESTTQATEFSFYDSDALLINAASSNGENEMKQACDTLASMATSGDDSGDWETVNQLGPTLESIAATGEDHGDWETVMDGTMQGSDDRRPWNGLHVKQTGSSIANVSDREYGSDLADLENMGPNVTYHPGAAGYNGGYKQRIQQNNNRPILLPTNQGHRVNGYFVDSNRFKPTNTNRFQSSPPLKADHKNPFESSPPEDLSPKRIKTKGSNLFPRMKKIFSPTVEDDTDTSGHATLGSSAQNVQRPSSYAKVVAFANGQSVPGHSYDGSSGRIIEHHHERTASPSLGTSSVRSDSTSYVNESFEDPILGGGMMQIGGSSSGYGYRPSTSSQASRSKGKAADTSRNGPFFHQSSGRHIKSKLHHDHSPGEERELDDLRAVPTSSDVSITPSGHDPYQSVQSSSNTGFAYRDPRAPIRNPEWRQMYNNDQLARIDEGAQHDGATEHRVGVPKLTKELQLGLLQEKLSKTAFWTCVLMPGLGWSGILPIMFGLGYLDFMIVRSTLGDITYHKGYWKRRALITGYLLSALTVALIVTLAVLAVKHLI